VMPGLKKPKVRGLPSFLCSFFIVTTSAHAHRSTPAHTLPSCVMQTLCVHILFVSWRVIASTRTNLIISAERGWRTTTGVKHLPL
jgi:hypothetical protein